MKVTITGGSGFIGMHVTEKLLKAGHSVLNVDRGTGKAPEHPGAEFAECDILDAQRLESLTRGSDAIMHLAALRSMKESVCRPHDYNRVNIDGTVNALEAARRNGVKKFVFASSSSVYGDSPRLPQKEDSLVRPSSPYGISKLAGENYCSVYARTFGVEAVSLRLFNVYGPDQPPDGGVVASFMHAAARGIDPPLYGEGKQSRDFVFVEDVADAFVLALKKSKNAGGMAVNIAGGKNYSVLQVLKMAEELSSRKLKPKRSGVLAGDVKDTLADIRLAKSLLGWTPRNSLREGLKKTFKWYVRNPMGEAQ